MTNIQVIPPFEIFTDVNGKPLEDGYLYIGQQSLDPETNPISVFWDEALTQPATQPIRTKGGYPSNAGAQARFYVAQTNYSVRVKNKNGTIVSADLDFSSAVEWSRSTLSSGINIVYQMLDAQPVNLWEKANMAIGYSIGGDPSTWDWTPAIEAAASAGRAIYVPRIPGGYYQVGDANIPQGTLFIGESVPKYVVANAAALKGESCFVKFGTATALFRGAGFMEFRNILFHGVDKTTTIFRHTSTLVHVRLFCCGCYGFDRAIGKNEAIGGFISVCSNYSGNNVGINNILDSTLCTNFINANTSIGINLGTGANDNTILGGKCEFNGTNLSTSGAVGNNIEGGVYDRASANNLLVGSGAEISITGIQNHRGGSSGTGSNLNIQGASRVTVNGMVTQHGTDDGGGGLDTPTINVDISGSCGLIIINGCDLTGVNGTTRLRRAAGTTFSIGLRVTGCTGVPDVQSDGVSVLTATGGAGSVTFNVPPVVNNQSRTMYIDLNARNSSGVVSTTRIAIAQNRGGGSAVITEQAKVFENPAAFFNTVGGSITYTIGTVATDGSSFVISFVNNTATATTVTAEIKV